MYTIIYWLSPATGDVYVHLNKDGTLTLFDTLKKADKEAYNLEKAREVDGLEARVISIEGVKE